MRRFDRLLPSQALSRRTVVKLSSSSAYTKSPGSLKLKGGLPTPDAKKKTKTKSSISLSLRDSDNHHESSASTSTSSNAPGSTKTEAQKRFEQVQKKRLLEKAAKAATKTHKERVAEFNEKLENMSEHYDIPRGESLFQINMRHTIAKY
ncbi:BQ2448_3548 [Microbotryum intermedium]|uniref:BQ2448_3548 protein n=1 Tax=Microbotryum intermedium TaxID=269621 RepID=A0A238FI84_9BASI|nr:BQ2448_3548 [Microbotryum intermedium]